MKPARVTTNGLLGLWGLSATFLVLATSIIALGTVVPGASATGGDPYSIQVEALFSPAVTDLTLRVDGPTVPSVLEKVQVKAWVAGDLEAETRNFFDVPSPEGVATIPLAGRARGDRVEVRVHLDERPQHNLRAQTTVRRRPDLTVTRIDVPDDVVRARAFGLTATIAEVGGDVGAHARVTIYEGAIPLAGSEVLVAREGRPLSASPSSGPSQASTSFGPSSRVPCPQSGTSLRTPVERPLYVNHYDADGVVATDHPLATQVGVDVLRSGGNAFDAAAAIQFALNVTQPQLSGIGGSSNVIVRDGETGEVFSLDARETAPAATTPTTYSRQDTWPRSARMDTPSAYPARSGPSSTCSTAGGRGRSRILSSRRSRWPRTASRRLPPRARERRSPVEGVSGDERPVPPSGRLESPAGRSARPAGPRANVPVARARRVSAFYEGEIAEAIVLAQLRRRRPVARAE